jgi:DNA topoisomerase-1
MSQSARSEVIAFAKQTGLIYAQHNRPGITRRKSGKRFIYFTTAGKRITEQKTIERINALVIPPAYQDVWICPSPQGHIQAVGKDARGRTQYRYHPKWREVRDEAKYEKMIAFGQRLPKIRSRVRRDLKLAGLPRNKVLATIVRLLETTLIRVGNEEYAKSNKSFGLTTIQNRHVKVRGGSIHFEFRGKSGVEHAIDITDQRLANVISKCQELPEQELFEYVDPDGSRHDVSSTDVNNYLHEIAGEEFTAKDFRTWAGTVLAAIALKEFEAFDNQTQAKKNVVAAIESVAKKLGNTRAVCRKCYIHPVVLETYMDGTLADLLNHQLEEKLRKRLASLKPEEAAVMSMLHARLSRGGKSK